MVTFNSILFNAAIIILPICLFELFGTGYGPYRTERKQPMRGRFWAASINVVTAVLCMAHPIELPQLSFDLRLVPFMHSFIYGGRWGGVAVSVAALLYECVAEPSHIAVAVVACVCILTVCSLLYTPAGRLFDARYSQPLLLASLLFSAIFGFGADFSMLGTDPMQPRLWVYFLLYAALHLALIRIIKLIHARVRANALLNQERIRSEKLHVLSEMAAAVAHEIRNPMTVARGFMQLLSRSAVDDAKKQTYTRMVIDEIDRAEKIINDYLSFAKPQAHRMQQLDMRDAVEATIQQIAPYAAAREVRVQCAAMTKPSPLLADMERLVQSLVNICQHGIDAMPEGGLLRLTLSTQADNVVLEVGDEGGGMNEEEISRLGTPFYAMDTEGTGLSIMVAYRIIESVHGHVEVRSDPGKGSTFTISLPRLEL